MHSISTPPCMHVYRLNSNGDVSVGDFGLAEDTYTYGYYRQEECNSVKLPYKWLALESMTDALFNEKTDVVSGSVVCYLLSFVIFVTLTVATAS